MPKDSLGAFEKQLQIDFTGVIGEVIYHSKIKKSFGGFSESFRTALCTGDGGIDLYTNNAHCDVKTGFLQNFKGDINFTPCGKTKDSTHLLMGVYQYSDAGPILWHGGAGGPYGDIKNLGRLNPSQKKSGTSYFWFPHLEVQPNLLKYPFYKKNNIVAVCDSGIKSKKKSRHAQS